MAVRKNIVREKKGKGKQYHLSYNSKAVGKNLESRKGTDIFGKKTKIKIKNRMGRISSCREIYTPLCYFFIRRRSGARRRSRVSSRNSERAMDSRKSFRRFLAFFLECYFEE